MLFKLPFFLILILASSVAFTTEEYLPLSPDQLPKHWRLSSIQETQFDSAVFVADVGQRTKPLVILIHGMGQAGLTDWLSVIPALETDYRVVAIDLPGFGRSEKPEGQYSPKNYAKVIHHIKQTFSKQPVAVVGHSMGAAVALRYASMYPDDIERVVLVAAAGILERTAFVKHSIGALIDGKDVPVILEGAKVFVEQYAGSIVEKINQLPDASGMLGNYQLLWGKLLVNKSNMNAGLALVDEDFSDAIFGSAHAVHLIWGENDDVAPLRTGKLLERQLPSSHLDIIDGASHVPMITHSAQFNNLLLSALTNDSSAVTNDSDIGREARVPSSPITDMFIAENETLTCNNDSGKVYSGYYKKVIINNCKSIVLRDVVTGSLEIKSSQLTLENIEIDSSSAAMIIDQSVVIGTNLNISGVSAIYVANSRIDFAGMVLQSSAKAISVHGPTQLIFSVSQLKSAKYSGLVHGHYQMASGDLAIVLNTLEKTRSSTKAD